MIKQEFRFYKYQGTGNDFVIRDDLNSSWSKGMDKATITGLCHRRFGVGADGMILVQKNSDGHFYMRYFNADGAESTMCGNGGRCFARHLFDFYLPGETHLEFAAADGLHWAGKESDLIELGMQDVIKLNRLDNESYELNTGSPHYVRFVHSKSELDEIIQVGKAVRYSDNYKEAGINVNLAWYDGENIFSRTYERGVEDETLSCGTGTVAIALAFAKHYRKEKSPLIFTPGGELKVRFTGNANQFTNISLIGPAVRVFEGNYNLKHSE
jgi:diaminopimelate epimerase